MPSSSLLSPWTPPLSRRGRGAAARTASSARHDEWTTDRRGNGRFFTVAAGFARPVSIAAGRGAAAIAAASARHHEWTISRRGNGRFSPSGPGPIQAVLLAGAGSASARLHHEGAVLLGLLAELLAALR